MSLLRNPTKQPIWKQLITTSSRGELIGKLWDYLEQGFAGIGAIILALADINPENYFNSIWWTIIGVALSGIGIYMFIESSRKATRIINTPDKI